MHEEIPSNRRLVKSYFVVSDPILLVLFKCDMFLRKPVRLLAPKEPSIEIVLASHDAWY
jgi:hypothetical protein